MNVALNIREVVQFGTCIHMYVCVYARLIAKTYFNVSMSEVMYRLEWELKK
jgi:hypothetical protein